MANTATIFATWSHPGIAYGVRFDSQYLPKEVWVVGFLAFGDGGEIRELLATGYIWPDMEASYHACVKYAREVLAGERKCDAEPYEGAVA